MPKKPKRPSMGRNAINHLMGEYKAGRSPGTTKDIRNTLVKLNSKYGTYPLNRISEWDRQARLDLARDMVSTGNPVYSTEYKRIAKPNSSQRIVGRTERRKDTKTRATNDGLEARADAAQPDATSTEKSAAKMYVAVEAALEAIDLLNG